MRCEDFHERMHDRLDQRLPLKSDQYLSHHAANCQDCRSEMQIWIELAPLVKSDSRGSTVSTGVSLGSAAKGYRAIPPMLTAVIAVAILIAVVGISPTESTSKPIILEESASLDTLAQATGELDPVVWWRSVQDRDWVEETMPTVRSVRKGVAPLGRTLVRAVTILTIGGEGRTS